MDINGFMKILTGIMGVTIFGFGPFIILSVAITKIIKNQNRTNHLLMDLKYKDQEQPAPQMEYTQEELDAIERELDRRLKEP